MSPSDRTLPPRPGADRGSRATRSGSTLVRWLPLVGAAVVGYVALSAAGRGRHQPARRGPGRRTARWSRRSPSRRRSPPRRSPARASRARFSVRPVYRYSPTAYDSALAAARSFFAELERAEQQGPDLLRAVAATRVSLGPAETELS